MQFANVIGKIVASGRPSCRVQIRLTVFDGYCPLLQQIMKCIEHETINMELSIAALGKKFGSKLGICIIIGKIHEAGAHHSTNVVLRFVGNVLESLCIVYL